MPDRPTADSDAQRRALIESTLALQAQALRDPAFWRPMTLGDQLRVAGSAFAALLRRFFTR